MTQRGKVELTTLIFVTACSVGSLDTGDLAVPSLAADDFVSVTPSCVRVSSSAGLGAAKSVVVVQARRISGQGAESVPVRFVLGRCPSWSNRPDAAVTASACDDGGPGNEDAPGCAPGNGVAEDPEYVNDFALLVENAKLCTSHSTADVECMLDPNGSISINVQGSVFDAGTLGNPGVAPLCIAIREQGATPHCDDGGWFHKDGWRYHQSHIVPSRSTSSEQVGFIPVLAGDKGCNANDEACHSITTVASVQIGILGHDAVGATITPQSFEALLQDVTLQASAQAIGTNTDGPAPYLSMHNCDSSSTDAGTANPFIEIDLPRGQSIGSFNVCAAPRAKSQILVSARVTKPNSSAVGMVIVPVLAAAKVVASTDSTTFDITYCGETTRAINANEVATVAAGALSRPVQQVGQLSPRSHEICQVLDADADAGPADCKGAFTLTLNDGHVCRLQN